MVTRDIDVCAQLDCAAVQRLRANLADLNPVHRMTPQRLSFLDNPAEGTTLRNLYLDTDLGQVDLISEVTGVGDLAEVAKEAVEAVIFGTAYRVLSLDKLIQAKRALGREKDILGERELLAIKAKLDARKKS